MSGKRTTPTSVKALEQHSYLAEQSSSACRALFDIAPVTDSQSSHLQRKLNLHLVTLVNICH